MTMGKNKRHDSENDWKAATWEGSRREAMRRWATLPLEQILAAQEEMADLAKALGHNIQLPKEQQKVAEPKTGYGDSNQSKK